MHQNIRFYFITVITLSQSPTGLFFLHNVNLADSKMFSFFSWYMWFLFWFAVFLKNYYFRFSAACRDKQRGFALNSDIWTRPHMKSLLSGSKPAGTFLPWFMSGVLISSKNSTQTPLILAFGLWYFGSVPLESGHHQNVINSLAHYQHFLKINSLFH